MTSHEFRLMNGEVVPVPGENEEIEEPLTVILAKASIAKQLKLKVQQVVLFDQGLLADTDPIPEGMIQIYIREVKMSMNEFLSQVRKERTVCGELRQLSVYAHLSALPSDLGDVFPKLDELILTNNHISRCPESICQLTELKKFHFDGNQLKDFPPIEGLKSLTELNLDRNQFEEIPPGIWCHESLKDLSMNSNQLSFLPELGRMTSLQRLALAQNRIKDIPQSLGQLKNLTSLNLARNQLVTLPDVWNLPLLKQLDFSFNKLSRLPDSIVAAISLEELFVNHNRQQFQNTRERTEPPLSTSYFSRTHVQPFYCIISHCILVAYLEPMDP
eukprot:symbB.v1.2.034524.t1/scaffold4438.1/size39648/3